MENNKLKNKCYMLNKYIFYHIKDIIFNIYIYNIPKLKTKIFTFKFMFDITCIIIICLNHIMRFSHVIKVNIIAL